MASQGIGVWFFHNEKNKNKQKPNQKTPMCWEELKNMLEAMQIEFLTEKRR